MNSGKAIVEHIHHLSLWLQLGLPKPHSCHPETFLGETEIWQQRCFRGIHTPAGALGVVRKRSERHEILRIIYLLQVVPVHGRALSFSFYTYLLGSWLILAVLCMCDVVAMEMLRAVPSSLHPFISLQCVLVRLHFYLPDTQHQPFY